MVGIGEQPPNNQPLLSSTRPRPYAYLESIDGFRTSPPKGNCYPGTSRVRFFEGGCTRRIGYLSVEARTTNSGSRIIFSGGGSLD